MTSPPPLLAARNIGRQIPGRWLWRETSFELAAGQRMAIVGPSGSGKSVMMRCLAGLTALSEGEVFFKGRALSDYAMPSYRSRVLYLPQTATMLEGTVRENIMSVLSFAVNSSVRFDEEWVCRILRGVGRDVDFLNKTSDSLSGGERQIVALLRALQLKPEVLLLDEPIASLDDVAGDQLAAVIKQALAESDLGGVIWTAHQLNDIGLGFDSLLELD